MGEKKERRYFSREFFTKLLTYEWCKNRPGGFGSDTEEKTVDIMVTQRFKKRGMSGI